MWHQIWSVPQHGSDWIWEETHLLLHCGHHRNLSVVQSWICFRQWQRIAVWKKTRSSSGTSNSRKWRRRLEWSSISSIPISTGTSACDSHVEAMVWARRQVQAASIYSYTVDAFKPGRTAWPSTRWPSNCDLDARSRSEMARIRIVEIANLPTDCWEVSK